jgi:hypothetical protein
MRPLDQHHMAQIRSLHGCTERLIFTRYVALFHIIFSISCLHKHEKWILLVMFELLAQIWHVRIVWIVAGNKLTKYCELVGSLWLNLLTQVWVCSRCVLIFSRFIIYTTLFMLQTTSPSTSILYGEFTNLKFCAYKGRLCMRAFIDDVSADMCMEHAGINWNMSSHWIWSSMRWLYGTLYCCWNHLNFNSRT